MNRSLLLFEAGIKSPYTKKNYRTSLDQFLQYTKITEYDALVTLRDSALQEMLEDYLFYLKRRMSPNSLPPKFAALQLFFSMNDKTLNFKKIKKMFPEKTKKSGFEAWATKDIQKMLLVCNTKRQRAIILFLSSTGVRLGVLPDLRMKHIKTKEESYKKVIVYEGTNEEYVTFLTPEASRALDEYLDERRKDGEVISEASYVFRKRYQLGIGKPQNMSAGSIADIISRIIRNSGVIREKNGKRFNIQINHGFRKRYNTILKLISDVNPNIAEKLLGHKNGLDGVYFVPTEEELFVEFKKSIPELTVNDSERKNLQIQKLEIEKMDLERKIPALVNDAVARATEKLRIEGWIPQK
jgi:integrase/recombinase XerD